MLQYVEGFWEQKDVANFVLWNILPLRILLKVGNNPAELKIHKSDSLRIEKTGLSLVPQRALYYNTGTVLDLDLIHNLQYDYHVGIYYDTLLLKPLFRRLLRLSQCSKQLHRLVLSHTMIKEVCLYFSMKPFQTIKYKVNYDEEKPLVFMREIVRNSEQLGNEYLAILNYRPPPPQPKVTKKRVATKKVKNTTPKKKLKSKQ